MFTRSTSRRRLAAWIAPALGLFLAGQTPEIMAYDDACCPPPVSDPCQPGIWLPTTPIQSGGQPNENFAPENSAGMAPGSTNVPSTPAPADLPPASPVPDNSSFQNDDFAAPESSNFDVSSGLASNFGQGGATALAFADTINTPGYIDSAIIQSRVRVRYDNATGANEPGRAGFLYPTLGQGLDYEGGRGPTGIGINTGEVDIEQISTYLEIALRERLSVFIDVPVRFIGPIDLDGGGPLPEDTQSGFSDLSAGFRWGWIAEPDEHLTFQLRATAPTGRAREALGTGNTTMDFSLLYDRKINDITRLYAEINDWQTLDAVDLRNTNMGPGSTSIGLLSQDANIMRFGLGLGVDLWSNEDRYKPVTVTGLFETVAWTVLQGVNSPLDTNVPLEDASGDTIVNGKYGMRISGKKNSMYVGYGHNWSSDRWYSDLLRIELQHNF